MPVVIFLFCHAYVPTVNSIFYKIYELSTSLRTKRIKIGDPIEFSLPPVCIDCHWVFRCAGDSKFEITMVLSTCNLMKSGCPHPAYWALIL